MKLMRNFDLRMLLKKTKNKQNFTWYSVRLFLLFVSLNFQHYVNVQAACNTCKACPKGFYEDVSSSKCEDCPAGFHQDESSSKTCKACPKGFYEDESSVSTSKCKDCPAGFHQDESSSKTCKACRTGYFGDESSGGSCKICNTGQYQNSQQQESCIHCLEGTYQNEQGQSSCIDCALGKYNDEKQATSSSKCELCTEGKYNDETARKACKSCTVGQYSVDKGNHSCTNCGAGQYNDEDGQTGCGDCPSGFYNPNTGNRKCFDCNGTDAGATSCDGVCGLGKFRSASNCDDCPKGWFGEGGDTEPCKECPKGFHGADAPTQYECHMCEVGKWSDQTKQESESSCKDCARGKYSAFAPGIQLSNCYSCEKGKYNNELGADHKSRCKLCVPGQWSDAVGLDSNCTVCPVGKFSVELGAKVECTVCPVGFFSAETGQATCSECLPGTYLNLTGQPLCKKCPAGYWQIKTKQLICDKCLQGKYQTEESQASCSPCIPGTFQSKIGSTSCEKCRPGNISEDLGSTVCKECPAGYYQNGEGQTSCEECRPGQYSSEKSQHSCKECILGQYQSKTGQRTCIPVDSNTITKSVGSSYPTSVPPGWKKTDCSVEEPFVCTDVTRCLEGTYGEGRNATKTKCLDCPPGTSSNVASMECDVCPRGKYWKSENKKCTDCPNGFYQDEQKQQKCMECPHGFIANNTGLDSCKDLKYKKPKDCLKDTEYLDTNNNTGDPVTWQCKPCPRGAICNDDSTDNPMTMGTLPGWWRVSSKFNNGRSLPVEYKKSNEIQLNLRTFPLFEECSIKKRCLGDPIGHKNANFTAFDNLVRNASTCCDEDEDNCKAIKSTCCAGSELSMPLCGVCKVGWTKRGTRGCRKCTGASHALQLVFICLLAILLLFFFNFIRKKLNFQLQKLKTKILDILLTFSMIVTYCQISSALPSTTKVEWPEVFLDYLSYITVVNMDFMDITGMACGIRIDQARKLGFSIFVLVSLFGISGILYKVLNLQHSSKLKMMFESDQSEEINRVWAKSLGQIFDLCDDDGSGSIDADELLLILRILRGKQGKINLSIKSWGVDGESVDGEMKEAKRLLKKWGSDEASRPAFINGVMREPAFRNDKTQRLKLVSWIYKTKMFSFIFGTATQIAFIIHAPISRTAFQYLDCRQIGDQYFIKSDFSTQCYTSEYNRALAMAIFILVIFSFGLPFTLIVYLFVNRKILHTPRITANIGW
jgi:hypothetical protein